MFNDYLPDIGSYCGSYLPLSCEVHHHESFPCLSQLMSKLFITSDGLYKTVCVCVWKSCIAISKQFSAFTSTPLLPSPYSFITFSPSSLFFPLSFSHLSCPSSLLLSPSSPLLHSHHPISSIVYRSRNTKIQFGVCKTVRPKPVS